MSNDKIKSLQEVIDGIKGELKVKMSELISLKSQEVITAALAAYGITGKVAEIEWDFYPEGDDEGGTVYCPEGLSLTVDGEEIDMYDYEMKRKSKWSDYIGSYNLHEDINDFINDMSSEMHSAGVESLTINLEAEEN
jgi:hypothetical protein